MEKIWVFADNLIFKDNKIVVVRRRNEPFKGKLDFPGGKMELNETIEQAAIREAKEETGLDIEPQEILAVYSGPDRDPRGTSVNIVFIDKVIGGELKAGTDATEAMWVDINKINYNDMGFDHPKILEDFKKWLKSKGTYWSSK